jgi:hypothetical protein
MIKILSLFTCWRLLVVPQINGQATFRFIFAMLATIPFRSPCRINDEDSSRRYGMRIKRTRI